ncbi:hypothetical protein [Streptomyces sp. NPDC001970]
MLIAKPWYESGSFWQFAVTTLVAVTVGALGAFATLRANNPKRRLSYRTLTNTSLLTASTRQAAHLSVTYGGIVLERPRLVEVQLRNTGRRDITSSMFHGSDPIKLDLGVNSLAVLDVELEPATSEPPRVVTNGAVVEVQPSLLVRGQSLTLSLLVDGDVGELQCRVPLVDVQVKQERSPEEIASDTECLNKLAIRLTVGVAACVAFILLNDLRQAWALRP